jgi:hypothetical protein
VGGAASIFTDSTKRSAGLGIKQDDSFQVHYHLQQIRSATYTGGGGVIDSQSDASPETNAPYQRVKEPTTDGTNGTPRTATESRPKNIGVNYIIKY